MSRCLPHIPPIRHGLQGPTKQCHQRELGTPSLAPALAPLPLANQGKPRGHTPRTLIGVAVGDAVHKTRHWQHRSSATGWSQQARGSAILACLFEFEWHCGGITQPFRQHVMHGHRWRVRHRARCGSDHVPLVARHSNSAAAFLSHARGIWPSVSSSSRSVDQSAKPSVERPLEDPLSLSTKIWCRPPRS